MARPPFETPDHNLWEEVRKSIRPLTGARLRSRASAQSLTPSVTPAPRAARTVEFQGRPHRHSPPPLAAPDRRTAQKLSRGQLEPDARIDLHGEGVEMARVKLLHFLAHARQQGYRLALVITGKGASPFARHTLHGLSHFHTPEREGRLRREVPLWLHEDVFRHHAIGYQPAHPRHGGGGAFYVRPRRNTMDDPS